MNLAQLQNFVRILDARSLSRAAAIIGIVQPALSRQVKGLEREFGVALLIRHGGGVTATPAGEALAASIRRMMMELQSARETVHAIEHEPAGLVTVGAPSSLAAAFFPPLFEAIHAKYPRVRLRLIDELSNALLQRTMRGEIDLAVLNKVDLAVLNKGGAIERTSASPFIDEPLGLVGSPAAIAALGGEVTLQTLATLPIVAPTAAARSRTVVERELGDLERQLVAEVECLPAMLQIVAGGHGFAIISYSAAEGGIQRGVLAFQALNLPRLKRASMLVQAPMGLPTAALTVVERELRALAVEMSDRMRWSISPA